MKSYLFAFVAAIILLGCSPDKGNQQSAAMVPDKADPAATTPQCSLRLGYDVWEPYQFVDVRGRVTGLDIELMQMIISKMNCQLSYHQGTWVELMKDLRAGDIDILLGASKTPERESFALFSAPYRTEEFTLYIRKGEREQFPQHSIREFLESGARLGVVENYVYGPTITAMQDDPTFANQFVMAIMGELNVARLLDGDIDGFLDDSFVGASMIRRKGLEDYVEPQGIVIDTGDVYVMFSRASVQEPFVLDFNQALGDIKRSGEYERLLRIYKGN